MFDLIVLQQVVKNAPEDGYRKVLNLFRSRVDKVSPKVQVCLSANKYLIQHVKRIVGKGERSGNQTFVSKRESKHRK